MSLPPQGSGAITKERVESVIVSAREGQSKMMSSGHDRTAVLMKSWQLCLLTRPEQG